MTVVRLGLTLSISRSFLQARTACLKPDSLSDMHPCSRWWKVSAVMGAPFDAISSTMEKAVSKSPQCPNAFWKTQPSRGILAKHFRVLVSVKCPAARRMTGFMPG